MSQDDELLTRIRQQLQQSEQDLPNDTQRQLRQARQQALQRQHRPQAWLWPASGLAVAATVGVLSFNLILNEPQESLAPAPADLELLSQADNLEIMQELDFILWLEDEQQS